MLQRPEHLVDPFGMSHRVLVQRMLEFFIAARWHPSDPVSLLNETCLPFF